MTLLDDDEATVVLSAVPSRVSEGGGPVAVVVTATLTGSVLQEAATVTVSVAGSGDPDAVDFEPVSDFAINIAAGGTSGTGTFTLVPKDDAEDEVDEILAVTGESALSVVSDVADAGRRRRVVAGGLGVGRGRGRDGGGTGVRGDPGRGGCRRGGVGLRDGRRHGAGGERLRGGVGGR